MKHSEFPRCETCSWAKILDGRSLCCTNEDKLYENAYRKDFTNDELTYPYVEGVKYFIVGLKFGCIHHSEISE